MTPLAVRAIGTIGDPGAVEGLLDLWRTNRNSDDCAIHLSASEALVHIGKLSVPALVKRLTDPDWHVRWHSVGTLGWLGDRSVREAVAPLTSDPHGMVRDEAQSVLEKLK